mgnify:CR=1 FL=1
MSEKRSRTVAPLHAGPLDVIGDVHGEFAALRALIGRLGYDEFGLHPDGRRAVRGCSFQCPPGTAGPGSRLAVAPGLRDEGIGFRLVRAR